MKNLNSKSMVSECITEKQINGLPLQVVAPREGSPLHFSSIQDFALTTFKDLATSKDSADVRQVGSAVACELAFAQAYNRWMYNGSFPVI